MKKIYLALALAVLLAGLVVAHGDTEEEADEDDLYYSHMIDHHGSIGQWIEDHTSLDWDDHQETTGGWRGCH